MKPGSEQDALGSTISPRSRRRTGICQLSGLHKLTNFRTKWGLRPIRLFRTWAAGLPFSYNGRVEWTLTFKFLGRPVCLNNLQIHSCEDTWERELGTWPGISPRAGALLSHPISRSADPSTRPAICATALEPAHPTLTLLTSHDVTSITLGTSY